MIRARSAEVSEGAGQLRDELNGGDCDLEDLYELEKDADEGFRRIEELMSQTSQVARQVEPIDALIECFAELKLLDEDSRERIACLIERKVGFDFLFIYFFDRSTYYFACSSELLASLSDRRFEQNIKAAKYHSQHWCRTSGFEHRFENSDGSFSLSCTP
jgi:hypothetical protein